MARKKDADEPTLGEAWSMLADRYGFAVEEHGERSITAHGHVRDRTVEVAIDGQGARSEFWRFFFGVNTISSRNRREKWHTELSVSCRNPSGITGTIQSAVDVDDPSWNPREYDPRNGRKIMVAPEPLIDRALDRAIHERLMSIRDDVVLYVEPNAVRIDHDSTALPGKGANYVAGSLIHHFQGKPPPWPDRALVGPPWWIDLLCDVADRLDS